MFSSFSVSSLDLSYVNVSICSLPLSKSRIGLLVLLLDVKEDKPCFRQVSVENIVKQSFVGFFSG